MADPLEDLQPWSTECLSCRQCVPGGDDPIKLAPGDEDRYFEVAETVDEAVWLAWRGEGRRGNGFARRVRAGSRASRVHLVDTALEDEATILEEQLEQQTSLFARWLGFDTVEQVT